MAVTGPYERRLLWHGLSTDTKPGASTEAHPPYGSLFYEYDTKDTYIYVSNDVGWVIAGNNVQWD
jgi:hypothetical protein